MLIEKPLCPECGEPAKGTIDTIPGLALITFDDVTCGEAVPDTDAEAEWSGSTEIDWDNQTIVRDKDDNVTLQCPNYHQWQSKLTG